MPAGTPGGSAPRDTRRAGGDTPSSRSRAPPEVSLQHLVHLRVVRRRRAANGRRRRGGALRELLLELQVIVSDVRLRTGGRGAGSSGVRGDGRGRTGRSRATRGSFAHLVLEPGVVLLANGVRVVREMRVAVIAVVPRHGGRLATRRAPGARRVTEGCGGSANLFLLGARKSVYVPAHAGVFLEVHLGNIRVTSRFQVDSAIHIHRVILRITKDGCFPHRLPHDHRVRAPRDGAPRQARVHRHQGRQVR